MAEQDWLKRHVEEHYSGVHWEEGRGWVDGSGTLIPTRKWKDIRREIEERRSVKRGQ